MSPRIRTRWLLVTCLIACALPACSKTDEASPPDDQANAQITAYNHTADYIHQFYIDGTWGGNSRAYGGGGKSVCCISYPRKWVPGLTAKVKWTTSSSDPKATGDAATEHWHESTVAIDQYVKTGSTLNVHFLPAGQVRLVISSMSAGHPDYPGPKAPERPADFKFQQ